MGFNIKCTPQQTQDFINAICLLREYKANILGLGGEIIPNPTSQERFALEDLFRYMGEVCKEVAVRGAIKTARDTTALEIDTKFDAKALQD